MPAYVDYVLNYSFKNLDEEWESGKYRTDSEANLREYVSKFSRWYPDAYVNSLAKVTTEMLPK